MVVKCVALFFGRCCPGLGMCTSEHQNPFSTRSSTPHSPGCESVSLNSHEAGLSYLASSVGCNLPGGKNHSHIFQYMPAVISRWVDQVKNNWKNQGLFLLKSTGLLQNKPSLSTIPSIPGAPFLHKPHWAASHELP